MPTAARQLDDRPLVANVGISHPDRVIFSAADITKLGLARYYESIADWILPHLEDRPLTLVRCPGGVGREECFYLKHSKVWGPLPIRRVRIREKTKVGEYLRNNRTNTSIAAYSTRAKPDATVSVPIEWTDLSASKPPDRFTIETVLQRLSRLRSDPWKAYWTTKQMIPRRAVAALERL